MFQSIVFHVSPHPKYPSFYQCVSFGFFTSAKQEMAYNLFCVLAVYFFPLIVILVSYTAIMCEISHKSKETNGDCYQPANGRMRLRRSDMTNIERARSRTLKMTVTIVVVFVWCWTPYVVMTLWYMFDRESAAKVANWIQDALFMMAVSNSCMNPMVYGSYAMNFRKECSRCLGCWIMCPQDSPSRLARKGTDVDGGAGQGGIKRRVIKCVYTLRKVGSATRSTTMLHGVTKSPAGTLQTINHTTVNHLAKSPARTIARLPSVGHISLVSEPLDNDVSYRPSFHSEPTGQSPFLRAERNVSNIELYSHSKDVECTSTRPIL
ncbi:Adipokinetic hormone receptor [Carabus blaptoides fortunei]